jgi:hypothetical protein
VTLRIRGPARYLFRFGVTIQYFQALVTLAVDNGQDLGVDCNMNWLRAICAWVVRIGVLCSVIYVFPLMFSKRNIFIESSIGRIQRPGRSGQKIGSCTRVPMRIVSGRDDERGHSRRTSFKLLGTCDGAGIYEVRTDANDRDIVNNESA